MVAQLNLLQQQAAMDKKQIREELFDLKNRIKWLEDRAMERQVEPTEPSSSQRYQIVLLQPKRQDHNNIMIPSLHPVLNQQDVWETWNRSKHIQLHQTTPSVDDDSLHVPHAYEDVQRGHESARWGQLNRDYNNPHDNKDGEITTTDISDDEDDLAAILDLPPAKSKRGGHHGR